MDNVENQNKEPSDNQNVWKTFAVYSGASLQLGTCLVVFGYLGHLIARQWNMPWLTVAGVVFGFLIGATGLAFLVKRLLGDGRE